MLHPVHKSHCLLPAVFQMFILASPPPPHLPPSSSSSSYFLSFFHLGPNSPFSIHSFWKLPDNQTDTQLPPLLPSPNSFPYPCWNVFLASPVDRVYFDFLPPAHVSPKSLIQWVSQNFSCPPQKTPRLLEHAPQLILLLPRMLPRALAIIPPSPFATLGIDDEVCSGSWPQCLWRDGVE